MNIYQTAQNLLLNHKDLVEQQAYANLQECLKNEQFKTLHQQEQKLIIELSKKEYTNVDCRKEKEQLEKIRQQKTIQLNKMGVALESLLPHYHCPICQDSGKTKQGRCQCYYQIVAKLLLKECGLEGKTLPRFEDTNFTVFKKEYQAEIKNLYHTAKKFIEKLNDTNKETFTLCGLSGTGKTYLAECMASYAIEKYIPTYFVSSFSFNNDMLAYHCAKLEEKSSIMEKYLDADLLIIDDLGTETILKNVTLEYLYLVLTHRITNHKKTVITTNLFPDDILNRYEERIFSRLTNKKESIFVEMKANNLRHEQ